jgi:hypothetical protein
MYRVVTLRSSQLSMFNWKGLEVKQKKCLMDLDLKAKSLLTLINRIRLKCRQKLKVDLVVHIGIQLVVAP